MSVSIILTNTLLCSFAMLLLIPLVRNPKLITFKNGVPLLVFSSLMYLKLMLPYEFSFTTTLPSKFILPLIRSIGAQRIISNITVHTLLITIWASVSCILFLRMILIHRKYAKVLSVVPVTKDPKIMALFNTLCEQKKIKNIPKLIMLDQTTPFVFGFRKPILVLPNQLSEEMYQFILLHELEHVKYGHVFVKSFAEIIMIIYWWNPIVWIIHKELIRTLEVHSDSNVMKSLDEKNQMNYLNSIITLTRRFSFNQASTSALTFTLNENFVVYRIKTALSLTNDKTSKYQFIQTISILLVSVTIFIGSFFYTFEGYKVSPENVEGTFLLNSKTDYFITNEDQTFDLYVNGEFVITLPAIPEDLSNLPVK
ncbi:M56 family metallopeptidase [Fusibacter bizertensis]